MKPSDLARYRGATIPDLIAPGVRLLLVGINPGLHSAYVQAPFSRPGNRFWPALWRAGILDELVDASTGLDEDERSAITDRGIGITSIVAEATARADELTAQQLRDGAPRVVSTIQRYRPAVVAVLGLTAFRIAFARPKAVAGEQPDGLADARLWVLPSPSGLNAHETIDSLATAYRAPALAAGIVTA